MTPETRNARSSDVHIAYQAVGDAPRDLALQGVPGEWRLFSVEPEGRRE
jgi:hypothetical protein